MNTTSMEGGFDFFKDFIGRENRDSSHHIAGSISLPKSPLGICVFSF